MAGIAEKNWFADPFPRDAGTLGALDAWTGINGSSTEHKSK
jgi:hypothetical protein